MLLEIDDSISLAVQHYILLERNLIYTAVTRGKKLAIIIGQPKALAMAVKNRKSTRDQKNGKVNVAVGYHRMCAVYSLNEDEWIPCKIV